MLAHEKARELERRLCQYLGVPGDGEAARARATGVGATELAALWQAVRDLERACDRIGKLPVGYPWYLNVVMKVIAALLPWYTRPLVEFGRQTANTVRRITEVLVHIGPDREPRSPNSGELSRTESPEARP
jgi:hypothetical protein